MHDVGDHVDGEELHGVYSSPGIISAIKSRNMGRVGHVETLGKGSCIQNIGPETCGEYIKVFHSVRSCTSDTSSVFQTNEHSVTTIGLMMQSSGLLCSVYLSISTDVSKDHIVFIFRVKQSKGNFSWTATILRNDGNFLPVGAT